MQPEKVIMPLLMISRKRYVGAYYLAPEDTSGKIKYMGVQLKRNDQAPITKIIYSGIVDILVRHLTTDADFQQQLARNPNMDIKKFFVQKAQRYARQQGQLLLKGKFPMDKFVLSRSLRSAYINPESIKHKVLADRANERGSDHFQSNDRIHFVHIVTKDKKGEKVLQGDRIETVEYVQEHKLKIDYQFYLTNAIEKPIAQMLSLGLEAMEGYQPTKHKFSQQQAEIKQKEKQIAEPVSPHEVDRFVAWFDDKLQVKELRDKLAEKRQKAAASITFDPILATYKAQLAGNQAITNFYTKK